MDLTTMVFHRSKGCYLLLALLLSLQLTTGLATGDVGVYWGRNKYEGTLREARDTGKYSTVIISFLSVFGHGKYALDLTGHPLAGVGDDIKHCKSKRILVLLSIGGQGSDYSLPSSQAAADFADYLWNAFLGGSRAGVFRPFGDAAVDGIDFFIDHGPMQHYDELARRLYDYTKYYRLGRVTLMGTTRCRYPDQRLQAALDTGLFDRVHVRLYGGDRECLRTPRDSLEKWAAAYSHKKVFVGVLASPEADAKKWPNYGGIVIWNRFYDKMTGYEHGL